MSRVTSLESALFKSIITSEVGVALRTIVNWAVIVLLSVNDPTTGLTV